MTDSKQYRGYELIAFVGAFVPTEIVIARSRFKFIIDFWTKYHLKRNYKYTPVQLKTPDGERKWINSWETTEKKEDLPLLGDNADRCDVVAIKQDLMRFGEVIDLTEVTEEQVLKEIEAKSSPAKTEQLDDATARLESIRKEMEQKKKVARGENKSKLIVLK